MSKKQNESLELVSRDNITTKELIMLVLGMELFYVGFLNIIMFINFPNLFESTVLITIYVILTIVIGGGVAVGSFYIIYTEISKIIITPDEIIIINHFNKILNKLNKIELSLIRGKEERSSIEVCTLDVSKEFLLRKFVKDKKKIIELADRIMKFCNKHFPNATNSDYFNEINYYMRFNEKRTGTII